MSELTKGVFCDTLQALFYGRRPLDFHLYGPVSIPVLSSIPLDHVFRLAETRHGGAPGISERCGFAVRVDHRAVLQRGTHGQEDDRVALGARLSARKIEHHCRRRRIQRFNLVRRAGICAHAISDAASEKKRGKQILGAELRAHTCAH